MICCSLNSSLNWFDVFMLEHIVSPHKVTTRVNTKRTKSTAFIAKNSCKINKMIILYQFDIKSDCDGCWYGLQSISIDLSPLSVCHDIFSYASMHHTKKGQAVKCGNTFDLFCSSAFFCQIYSMSSIWHKQPCIAGYGTCDCLSHRWYRKLSGLSGRASNLWSLGLDSIPTKALFSV